MGRRPTEQDELRSAVRAFLEDKSPESRVRAVMETDNGFDGEAWKQLTGELGLAGLLVPEEHGGAGAGVAETAVVLEETGRSLACVPYLSQVLAVSLLRACGDTAVQAELLPGLADGSTIATVAVAEQPAAPVRAGGHTTTAVSTSEEWRITGRKVHVLDAAVADVVLVVATAEERPRVFAVRPGPGVSVEQVRATDATRRPCVVDLDRAPATPVGAADDTVAIDRMLDLAAVALAAEDAGGAARVLELASDYAGIRTQFGRVIGANQAIKQKLADTLASVQLARAAVRQVADAADTDSEALPLEAAMAKSLCSDAYVGAAYDGIQVHGGVGFTWEHPAHLYLRRALSNAQLFGSPDHHRERAAQLLLGDGRGES